MSPLVFLIVVLVAGGLSLGLARWLAGPKRARWWVNQPGSTGDAAIGGPGGGGADFGSDCGGGFGGGGDCGGGGGGGGGD
ncbi:hypothetical protein EK0264_17090 [Epidermidibacterium keratini]|uniref:Uncharacterized protein n=1 Tax=Epidermidibacterium keratini TaxID=1891644 RepID=A0A7L4YSE9_9ACTN|nr:hypothetical protein [Epidermidibacterium keratini]QHC01824.1 hypothetical protein EK0264_17090 [Epidermidibacterium keratini]